MLVSQMPVGHKQFTEIARELSKEDSESAGTIRLLVLDEPTAVLSEKEAETLLVAMVARIYSSEGRSQTGPDGRSGTLRGSHPGYLLRQLPAYKDGRCEPAVFFAFSFRRNDLRYPDDTSNRGI